MPDELNLGDKSLDELSGLNDLFTRNANQRTKAAKAKGGVGTNKLDERARESSRKQIQVEQEIRDRLFDIHQDRPALNQELDEEKRAPVLDNPSTWANNPDQFDWPGVDLPE